MLHAFCSGELFIITFIVSGINIYIYWKREEPRQERENGENIGSSRALPRGSFTLLGKPDSRHQPLSQSCGRDGGRVRESQWNNGQRERGDLSRRWKKRALDVAREKKLFSLGE